MSLAANDCLGRVGESLRVVCAASKDKCPLSFAKVFDYAIVSRASCSCARLCSDTVWKAWTRMPALALLPGANWASGS